MTFEQLTETQKIFVLGIISSVIGGLILFVLIKRIR